MNSNTDTATEIRSDEQIDRDCNTLARASRLESLHAEAVERQDQDAALALRSELDALYAAPAPETPEQRIARLGLRAPEASRMKSLTIAHPMVDDATFRRLVEITRLSRRETIVLPALRYESLARGKGWARQGQGAAAVWGERVDGGYRVGPGRWTVGATDGFSRSDRAEWRVRHITVGGSIWTLAD